MRNTGQPVYNYINIFLAIIEVDRVGDASNIPLALGAVIPDLGLITITVTAYFDTTAYWSISV